MMVTIVMLDVAEVLVQCCYINVADIYCCDGFCAVMVMMFLLQKKGDISNV